MCCCFPCRVALWTVSIPIVSIIDLGLDFFDGGLDDLIYHFDNYGSCLVFTSVGPLLVKGRDEENMDDAGSDPGEGEHDDLDNSVCVTGGEDVSVDLTELLDGRDHGDEVEDPYRRGRGIRSTS